MSRFRGLANGWGLLFLVLLFLTGCSSPADKRGIDWSITLDHNKKTPYAASIAYETLPRYFPSARREALSRWFRYTSIDEHMYGGYDSASLLVMLGLHYSITDEEWLSLLKFAKAGNEVFLLSSSLDDHFTRALHCRKESGGDEEFSLNKYYNGSESRDVLRLVPDSAKRYGYTGRTIVSYYAPHAEPATDTVQDENASKVNLDELKIVEASIDTLPTLLGIISGGKPDFLRYKVGNGHITLHAAPLVLSNYFLLQDGNRAYLDSIWHSFPANISVVYWNEYFKRSGNGSSLSVLLKYPAMRWALIIAVCTLLLYVLFGLKRLQRVVPVLPAVENSSVAFVETVGKLYFNKAAHSNLAEKMAQHFLEWVRNNYYLDTTQLNDAFIRQLAAKSGRSEEETTSVVNRIHEIRLGIAITPEYLYELHHAIQLFYNAR